MAKKALLVGINSYGFPNDLPSGTRDAEAFGQALETIHRFDQIRLLKDAEASREAVERGLEWLLQGATAGDRCVFYFSGHGCRFDRNGVLQEALVLQDGRLLEDQDLAERAEALPPGVLTVVLDCCFAGGGEALLLLPTGQVEVARSKRWLPTEYDRGRHDRATAPGGRAFSPFGHLKPAPVEGLLGQVRGPAALDPSPARLVALAEPQARALLVLPCLGDEITVAATSQTGGLSAFTGCLLQAMRRLGPNRSTVEVLQATGHELRRLGLGQTPLVKAPLQPEHLSWRSFLTFQPVLFVHPSSTPGREREGDVTRSVAEAVRNTLTKEGPMHATMSGGQTLLGDDIGTIVNTVTPIVASVLQGRAHPPWAGGSPWSGGYGARGLHEEVGQIVSAVIPAVLPMLQGRFQPWSQFHGPLPYGQPFLPQFAMGGGFTPAGLGPQDLAQIVGTVTPIVTSLLQGRGYPGYFGQSAPRAA